MTLFLRFPGSPYYRTVGRILKLPFQRSYKTDKAEEEKEEKKLPELSEGCHLREYIQR